MKKAISSANLKAIDYDKTTQELVVTFRHSLAQYRYEGVPSKTVSTMLKRKSKGTYFNTYIRDQFAFTKIAAKKKR